MPPRRSTRASVSSAPVPAPSSTSMRASRARKASTPISEDRDSIIDSESEDDSILGSSEAASEILASPEVVKKKPAAAAAKRAPATKQSAPARRSVRLSSVTPSETDIDDRSEEEQIPTRKVGRKPAVRAAPRAKRVVSESESEDELAVPVVAAPVTPPAATKEGAETESSEDEANLNEDETIRLVPSTPARASGAKPAPTPSHAQYIAQQKLEAERGREREKSERESKEPKKRLVIHKLVLVDFKSYAGRQEIGPFHKVCPLNT